MPDLPTAEQAFGTAPLPSADQAFPVQQPLAGEALDHYFSAEGNGAGQVLNLFGQGFREGWGAQPLGLSADSEAWLRKTGVFADHEKQNATLAREFNEALIRPAAVALDALQRFPTALYHGVGDIALQLGVPRDIVSIGIPGVVSEAFPSLYGTGLPLMIPRVPRPVDLAQARNLGVIGRGEASWLGTTEMPAEEASRAAIARMTPGGGAPEMRLTPPEPPPIATGGFGSPLAGEATLGRGELPDIHNMARAIAPDAFTEYDALAEQKETARGLIDQIREGATQSPDAVAEQRTIDDILGKVRGVEDRLTNRQQTQLDAARDRLDAILDFEARLHRTDLMAADERMRDLAPTISAAYREAAERLPEPATAPVSLSPLQTTQESRANQIGFTHSPDEIRAATAALPPVPDGFVRMYHGGVVEPGEGTRWVAQDPVYAAHYREGGKLYYIDLPETSPLLQETYDRTGIPGAEARYAHAELPEDIARGLKPVHAPAAAEAAAAPAEAPKQISATTPAETSPPAAPAPPAPAALPLQTGGIDDIARDVSQQLVKADRPQDEANAAAAIIASHYEARAARFDGQLGTPFELWQREGAAIRARDQGGPQGAASGASRLAADGRTIITLFKRADASTFIHETGHQWLRELLTDAADPRAPQQLKDDAQAVRNWLGAGSGEPTNKQHEQFARGFETYMLEGRAPSPALAGIFAQFRQWLTALYQRVAETKLPVIDSVRGVYDRLVGMPDRVAIAPDRELPLSYDEAHARLAAETPAEHAAPIGDVVRDERDTAAAVELTGSEDDNRRADRAGGTETGGGAPRGGASDGQGAGRDLEPAEARGVPQAGAVGAGGGGVAAEGAAAPAIAYRIKERPAWRETAYVEVPPEPQRLAQFLKQAGGLVDDGGELRQIGAHRRPGLVNRNGLNLDDATLRAWEAGYLPGADRPEIGALLEHLERDLRGDPVYSAQDAADAAKFRQAMDRNAEIDKLAQEIGVDPRDWTREQFFNLVAGHLEGQRLEEAQRSLGEALEAQFAEAEAKAKAWAEERGDAWEPERLPEPRTLEDLERENAQTAGSAAPAGEGGAGGARPAAGDRGAVPGRGGQGGGAGGIAGGGGTPGSIGEPTEPPANGGRFGATGTRLVDKAGNIRLDNLNQPDDIDQAIRDAAARNDEFQTERRGVLSDGEVLDLADALGRDPGWLDRKKIGDAFSAEEVLAARQLLIRSATSVRDAMAAAAGGAQDAVLKLAQVIARHEMIQGKVAQATAEWGRAGRSFRMLMDGQADAANLDAFLREYSGRTLYQLQEMAQLGQQLDRPQQISKFVHDTSGGNIRRAIVYYWENALISGPVTHLRYSVGNAVNALWSPLIETPIAAAIDTIARPDALDRVRFGEAYAQLYGLMKGSRDGWLAATKAWKYGITPTLPGEAVPNMAIDTALTNPLRQVMVAGRQVIPTPVAKALGLPGNAVSAIHAFFKSIRYEQNIQALAYRTAAGEQLTGRAFTDRVAELSATPSEDMMRDSAAFALRELYMSPSDFNSFAGKLQRAVNGYETSNVALGAKIMIPFLKIGSQITRNAFIERTPLALASAETRGNLFSGTAASSLQAAKITAGVGLMGAMVMMTLEGKATGDGPADPDQRAVWLLKHQPNSFQVGPVTIPYQGLGHLGMLMRFAANMTETAQGWDAATGDKLALGFFRGFSKAVLDDNFMRGLHEALDAAYGDAGSTIRYLKNFATNWLPYSVGLGQVARLVDPYMRDARDLFDTARAKMPFFSAGLAPRRDAFGEPISNHGPLPQYANDPTVQALEDIKHGIGRLDRKIRGVDLDAGQYDDYSRIAGRLTKMRLDAVTGIPGWNGLPTGVRSELVTKSIAAARRSAEDAIMMQNPEIIRQAIDNKVSKLSGSPAAAGGSP